MKLTILKAISILLFSIFIGTGCEKEQNSEVEDVAGILLFYGSPAADGCGWLVKIDGTGYSPVNLEPKYKKDSTEVILSYDTLGTTMQCGWRRSDYKKIQINEIKNRGLGHVFSDNAIQPMHEKVETIKKAPPLPI